MNNEQNQGISRRSFIKRSTVVAIAATNMMMFTGLVNAIHISPSPETQSFRNMKACKVHRSEHDYTYPNKSTAKVWGCTALKSCKYIINCGEYYKLDADGNPEKDIDGNRVTVPVQWLCEDSNMEDPDEAEQKWCLR